MPDARIFEIGTFTLGITFAALSGAGCVADARSDERLATVESAATAAPVVDARRSLAITDLPILERFSLLRVMTQIIATSGAANGSSNGSPARSLGAASALFQQWWDTLNPGPGLGAGPHCDDVRDGDGRPTLNGYPYTCRPAPAEGAQSTCDPFTDPNSPCAYVPTGLFMRFDLAPEDGSTCGEYRISYAKKSGTISANDRNHVIFEAAMRNPHIEQGIRGCQRLVRVFASLSDEPDMSRRADMLERIYFAGYKEFDPVVQFANYGSNPGGFGQVRTNQFVQPSTPRVWSLREFKIQKVCSPDCSLRFVPVTNKVNPFGPLFDGSSEAPAASAFQAAFIEQVERLGASTLDGIGMNTPDAFNSGQSQAASSVMETNYVYHFGAAPSSFGAAPNSFRSAIEAKLTAIGSSLTPDDIVERAQAMSCAGCHRFSNGVSLGGGVTWPSSLGFTHVSEKDVDRESIDGVLRYRLSDALVGTFLPHRKQLLEDFLKDVPRPARPPKQPLGGRWTH